MCKVAPELCGFLFFFFRFCSQFADCAGVIISKGKEERIQLCLLFLLMKQVVRNKLNDLSTPQFTAFLFNIQHSQNKGVQ